MSRTGVLLFAHGARDPNWATPFHAVAAQVRVLQPHAAVRLAFLEFMPPDMASAGAELAAEGCSEVDVVPLFLGAGGHVRKDVPVLLAALQQAHPAVRFTLRGTVGESPLVIAAMAAAAVAGLPPAAQ
jgi:sirohydrochlorin cobaltochelatase